MAAPTRAPGTGPGTRSGHELAALGASLRLSLAASLTTWAATWSWRGFTRDSATYLVPLLLVFVAVSVTAALLRWRRLPLVLVLAGPALVGSVALALAVTGRPFPGAALGDAIAGAADDAGTYAAPVPVTEAVSVQPLLLLSGLLALLLVDLLACTLRRVPVAGLCLLTIYSVPVSLLDGGLSWWVFAFTAAGFLVMLFLQEQEHLGRWGRSLDPGGAPVTRLSDPVRSGALGVGAVAVAAAVVVPLAVPTLDLQVFDLGPGRGDGGEIDLSNPMVDMRRDLQRRTDTPLLRVRTNDPEPDHLRISALHRFTDNTWSNGNRQVPTSNQADGELPPLVGLDPDVPRATYDYDVEVFDAFRSEWLPTQAPVDTVVAEGDWRYDEDSMDFVTGDEDVTTAGLQYTMTAVEVDVDRGRPRDYAGGELDEELTELPPGLPAIVGELAREVTTGAVTDFQRASLLQAWFRDSGLFTYSLDPADLDDQVGSDDLEEFLREDGREGYCEQFAAAMAVMSRSLGIPARVAVGFLAPKKVGPDTWEYSSHDLHAWPELYFEGVGWTLFDPTPGGPGGRVPDSLVPAYTGDVSVPELPTSTASPVTREPRTEQPSASRSAQPDTPEQATGARGAGAEDGGPRTAVLLTMLALVVLALLARLPRALRRRRRSRRLLGGAESAWAELRATATDLGLAWPDARSPQETRAWLAQHLGRPGDQAERPAHGPDVAPEAAAALDRIADRVERQRYARDHRVAPGELADDVETVCAALEAGVSPRTRRRASWLPRSLTQRTPDAPDAPEPALTPAGSTVEHL